MEKPGSRPGPVWPLFLAFTALNSLLAYGNFLGPMLRVIVLLGIGLTGWFAWKKGPRFSKVLDRETDPSFPAWAWILVMVLGAVLRFLQLNTFQDFPLYDETINALWARKFLEPGTQGLFFGNLPPLYIGSLAMGFRFFGTSFTWLWLLPALLSILSLLLFASTARRLFPGRTAFFTVLFLSIGFWPLLLGRFSHQVALMVFWESAAFRMLATYRQAPATGPRNFRALMLGAWVGAGFYTYFGWPLLALLVLFILAWLERDSWTSVRSPFWKFLGTMFLMFVPALLDASRQGYLDYVWGLLAFHPGPVGSREWDPETSMDYFRAFLWARHGTDFAYTPQWGGFLNPVSGGLFLLGLVPFVKEPTHPWSRWLGIAFLVLFFPILLAKNANWLHVASLMPLFLGVAGVGLGVLLRDLGREWKAVWLVLMALSFFLDGTNLVRTRDFIREHQASPDITRAFQTLKGISRARGPGLIFGSLWLKPWPPFLNWATAPFNRLLQEGEPPASWAAVVANANLRPFLKERFPEGKAYWIPRDRDVPDGGDMVFVMDVTAERAATFQKWATACRALGPFLDQYAFTSLQDNRDMDGMLRRLDEAYPAFKDDPFLESVYWEANAYLRFQGALRSGTLKVQRGLVLSAPRGVLNPSIQALHQGILKGYPSSNLYYQLGTYLAMSGLEKQARVSFREATRTPLDLTDSKKALGDVH